MIFEGFQGDKLLFCLVSRVGKDSVGMATHNGLDSPGMESWYGRYIPHPSKKALEPIQPPTQWVPGLFPRVKASGAWR